MANHTPGPWAVTEDKVAVYSPSEDIIVAVTYDPRGDAAFYVQDGDEEQANLRLIAAAPALLHALRVTTCPHCRTRVDVARHRRDLQINHARCRYCALARTTVAAVLGGTADDPDPTHTPAHLSLPVSSDPRTWDNDPSHLVEG